MVIPTWVIILAASLIVLIGIIILITRFYVKVKQGQALIISKPGDRTDVSFTGAIVVPVIHRAEVMDISLKTIEIARRGSEGLVCKDNMRADIKVRFFVRVNNTKESVLQVAKAIGCERASDPRTLEELFNAKFSEALKTVGKKFEFTQLYDQRKEFNDNIIDVIGRHLNGYAIEDAAIDYLEQTPLEQLDPKNILDAEGIQKITEITTSKAILTNNAEQQKREKIKDRNVEADEKVFELERRRADAEAKQQREIASVKAREEAEILKIQAEERRRAEEARIATEEAVSIREENRMREVEVAKKNRERVVAVEHERVEKERQLEAISREREVDLSRISKEKEIEVEKKEIADVIAARVSVEKNVAEEEEKIKDLRATAGAKREKDVMIITAEGQAQEKLVKDIKAAEASEEVAKFKAREKLVTAEADLEASDKQAAAKIRLAEGVQAEVAAEGLARVKVKEADALAIEKTGLAEAKVTLSKMEASAQGEEKQGMARVKVAEAEAGAIEKKGLAEAQISREKLLAEAAGAQEKGLAGVRVKEADAAVVEKTGLAEARAIKEKLVAEAAGLADKAEAMKALDGVGREHEEFRLELDKAKEVELAEIGVRKDIAVAQAAILREAFQKANIQIVGGDGEFFDKFINAVSLGKSIDGTVHNSDTVQKALGDYLTGKASLPEHLRDVLTNPRVTSETLQNLSVAALLGRLAGNVDKDTAGKIGKLIERAKELGIDKVQS